MSKNSDDIIEKTIVEFIKNRTIQNESTASRHIHRRFDIPMEKAEQILLKLSEKKVIKEFYDKEYQESRYTLE